MLSDCHMHTEFSADSDTPVRSQVERALDLGMQEICITDHHDYDTCVPGDRCFLLDFESYFSYMRKIRQIYGGRIRVGIGVELGLQLHIREYLENLVHSFPEDVDYLIGSSHFIDRLDPYYPQYFEGRSERDSYIRYFEVTLDRIRGIDCFDAFGHLDYVVRYGPNRNRFYDFKSYQEYIDPILKTLIEKGKALECNAGGLKYGLGHPNPGEDILRRYRELGGELVTVGSDAHAPRHIGFQFDRVQEILLGCGFRYYTVYHRRQPVFLPL